MRYYCLAGVAIVIAHLVDSWRSWHTPHTIEEFVKRDTFYIRALLVVIAVRLTTLFFER